MSDGKYTLRFAKTGVYLKIPIAIEDNERFDFRAQLFAAFMRKGVEGIDETAVDFLLSSPNAEMVIAAPQREKLIDETATVSVLSDKMSAEMTFEPADGGTMLTAEQIYELLRNVGVTAGVDSSLIEGLAQNAEKTYHFPIVVAQGAQPKKGDDAYVEFLFNPALDMTPRMLEDGSVDHKNLDMFQNVNAGDPLATLHPEQPGIPGYNVFGAEYPAQAGKRASLPQGKNTKLSEDGLQLLAEISGKVELKLKKVTVSRVLQIKGDVGPATGNLEFFGDVIISGSVLSKYTVKATGMVDIGGVVEGACVSAGGNVVIRQGIKGMDECNVSAGGDITAKFIEKAVVTATGYVRADVIMHSKVSSYHKVRAYGKRGLIVGGVTRAAREVIAGDIGSIGSTHTILEVGVTPDIRLNLQRFQRDLELMNASLKRTTELMTRLEQMAKNRELSHIQKEQLAKHAKQRELLTEAIPQKAHEIQTIENLLQQTTLGKVHIKNAVYPNVVINIGKNSEKIRQALGFCSFHRLKGAIEMIPYCYNEEK